MTFLEELQKECCGFNSIKTAKMLANSLRQLSTGIYSEPERFIYELLQNAVDAHTDTNEDCLKIKIYTCGNFFVFLHNGAPFSERDIDGLCDVGNGNKRKDNKKVGYKGIGFKSVFMPTTKRVYVHSGEYSFKFDRSICANLYPFAQWAELKEDDIPWQVIPIPCDIPIELDMNGYNVAAIIESSIAQDLEHKTKKLFNNPQFLLFLRSSQISVLLYDNDNLQLCIEKHKDAFGKVVLKKDSEVDSVWLQYSRDIKLDENVKYSIQTEANVPDKLKETESVEISFALALDEHEEFIKLRDTVVYTFLPTAYGNLNLPFLVNANFITDSGREKLIIDSEWNKFIFSKIPHIYLEWLATLSSSHKEYARILPKLHPYVSDKLSDIFASALIAAIDKVAFIPNFNHSKLLKAKEAFIDELDIMSVLNRERFLTFISKSQSRTYNIECKIPNVYSSILSEYGVYFFGKEDIPSLFMSEFVFEGISPKMDFELISFLYKYYLSHKDEQEDWIRMLNGLKILLDNKHNLCRGCEIYIPTAYCEENNISKDVKFLDNELYSFLQNERVIFQWLKDNLNVKELSNRGFVNYILNNNKYITQSNAIDVIRFLFQEWRKENFLDASNLIQAKQIKIKTKCGTLLPIINTYLGTFYAPQDDIEFVAKDLDIFVSEEYYQEGDSKEDWKFFLKKCGAKDGVGITDREMIAEPITDVIKNALSEYPFLQEAASVFYSRKHGRTNYCNFKNPIVNKTITIHYFSFVNPLYFNSSLDGFILDKVLGNPFDTNSIEDSISGEVSYWRNIITDPLSNYIPCSLTNKYHSFLEYAINEKQLFPTVMGSAEKAENIFVNSATIKEIAGSYLPVLNITNTIHETWLKILPFKSRLLLEDYLLILSRIAEDSETDNTERVSAIYNRIIESGQEKSNIIHEWGRCHKILSKGGKYYSPKDLIYITIDGFRNSKRVYTGRLNEHTREGILTLLRNLGVRIITEDNIRPEFKRAEENTTIPTRLLSTLPALAVLACDCDEKSSYQERKVKLLNKIENTQFYQCESISLAYEDSEDKISNSTFTQDGKFYFTGELRPAKLEPLLRPLCSYLGLRGKECDLFVIMTEPDFSGIIEYLEDKGYDVAEIKSEIVPSNIGESSIATLGGEVGGGLAKISQIAENNEAKSLVLEKLKESGFDVSEAKADWSVIDGIKKDGAIYPLVVKSCKNWNGKLFINPSEWQQLFKPNSMLWLHFGDRQVVPIKAYELFTYQDQLTLSFDTINLMMDNRINKIMEVMHYFNNVHLDVASLKPVQNRAEHLEEYLFNDNNAKNSDLSTAEIDD